MTTNHTQPSQQVPAATIAELTDKELDAWIFKTLEIDASFMVEPGEYLLTLTDIRALLAQSAPDAGLAEDAKRLQNAYQMLYIEREKYERLFRVLMSIHHLTIGPDVQVGDATYRFVPPNAAEILHELSARIRAIPESITAALASQEPQHG